MPTAGAYYGPSAIGTPSALPAIRGAAAPYSFASMDATGQMENVMAKATMRAMAKNAPAWKDNMAAQIEAINDEITEEMIATISPQSAEQFRQKMLALYPSMLSQLVPIVGQDGVAAIAKGITDNIPIIWAKYAGPISYAIKEASRPMERDILDNIFGNIERGMVEYALDNPARRGVVAPAFPGYGYIVA